jgi:hypothetical protein
MKTATSVIALSLLANAVLLTLLLKRPADIEDVSRSSNTRAPAPVSAIVDESSKTLDVEEYYRDLIAAGLSEQQTKPLVLEHLHKKFVDAVPKPRNEYWTPSSAWQAEYMLEVDRARDHVRSALKSLYGEEASEDPVFQRVFAPLDLTLPFLASDQQIAIFRLRLQQQIDLAKGGLNFPSTMGRSPDVSGAGIAIAENFERAVAENLAADDLFEYQLRESATAKRILSSGVDFTEQQFRETYRAEQNFQSNPSAEKLISYRNELKDILGRTKYLQYLAAQDPGFTAIQEVASKHALRDGEILAIYEVMKDAQAELIAASRASPGGGDGTDIVEIMATRDRRLSELVGQEIAAEILQAHTKTMMSVSRQVKRVDR